MAAWGVEKILKTELQQFICHKWTENAKILVQFLQSKLCLIPDWHYFYGYLSAEE